MYNHCYSRVIMGILSGMLIAAGIAFFSKKKLTNNNIADTNKQESCTIKNEMKSCATTQNKQTPNLYNRIKRWITKTLRKQ